MTTGSAPVAASPHALEAVSDEVLADRAADGDVRAFSVLARRYQRLMRVYAARVLGSPAASDDAAQEALITAWQQIDTLQDRTAVRAWLLRITTRKALDALRAIKQHDDVDDLDPAAPDVDRPEQAVRAASLSEALDLALRSLPPLQARAWVLRELGGHSYDEIAAALELPVTTVRGLIARARIRLIRDMNDWR